MSSTFNRFFYINIYHTGKLSSNVQKLDSSNWLGSIDRHIKGTLLIKNTEWRPTNLWALAYKYVMNCTSLNPQNSDFLYSLHLILTEDFFVCFQNWYPRWCRGWQPRFCVYFLCVNSNHIAFSRDQLLNIRQSSPNVLPERFLEILFGGAAARGLEEMQAWEALWHISETASVGIPYCASIHSFGQPPLPS